MKWILVFFISINAYALTDKEYISKVSKSLKKNPNNISLIIKAGKYFYKKKNCKNAIWYFSSPLLKKSKKYIAYKYLQAKCHYKLKDYANAEYVILLVRQEKLPRRFSVKVDKLAKKIRIKTQPPAPPAKVSLTGHYGSISYSEEAQMESASVTGASLSVDEYKSNLEIVVERLGIKFNPSLGYSDYSQTDFVLGYSFFDNNLTHKNKFLIHTNSVNSEFAISTTSLMYGYNYFFDSFESVAVEFNHNSFKSTNEITAFSSSQISPSVTFGMTKNIFITLKANTSYNNYKGSDATDKSLLKNIYTSGEGAIGFYTDSFSLIYTKEVGDERFMLKSSGMLIQNSTNTYISSSIITANLKLGKSFSITGMHRTGIYKEENSDIEYINKGTIFFATLSF